jgi:hypothetical protein
MKTNIPAEKAKEFVNEIITDDIHYMRKNLRQMIDSFLISEYEPDYRRRVYETFFVLDTFLNKIEVELD